MEKVVTVHELMFGYEELRVDGFVSSLSQTRDGRAGRQRRDGEWYTNMIAYKADRDEAVTRPDRAKL